MRFDPIQTNQRPLGEKLIQRFWECARAFLCWPTSFFMRRWRVLVTKMFGSLYKGPGSISWAASLSRKCRIDYPWNVTIGEKSSVNDGAWVYALGEVKVGRNVCIGEDVKLLTGSHDVDSPTFDLVTKPICICDNVWIATGAMVMPGVTIGEGGVVAAGSVVTKDVEPWTVVGGNPAKFIKKRMLCNDNGYKQKGEYER